MPAETTTRRPPATMHLLTCLLLVIVGAVSASTVQTGGGHISVQGLVIPGTDGSRVSADLYRPDTATAEHRAPLVVTPGFNQTKETVVSYALEFGPPRIRHHHGWPLQPGEFQQAACPQQGPCHRSSAACR